MYTIDSKEFQNIAGGFAITLAGIGAAVVCCALADVAIGMYEGFTDDV